MDRGQLTPEYGGLLAAFATIFSVGVVAARRRGRLPEHVRADDIALGGIATFKLARRLVQGPGDQPGPARRSPAERASRSARGDAARAT